MKKAWSYISAVLTGIIIGMVAMYKLTGEQIEVNIKKVKNKRTSGSNTLTIPITIDEQTRKEKRLAKRNKKKK